MMTEVFFTAYNRDVQQYIRKGGRSTTSKKKRILDSLIVSTALMGKSFERMFPNRSKRKEVMDEILFLASGSGICKVESKTLAKKVGCSVRTVFDAVKSLKETGEVMVAGLADGKNKYIFVLRSHQNFKEILREVFYVEDAEQTSQHIAEQKNSETVEAVRETDDIRHANGFNSFITKHEVNMYIGAMIENELEKCSKDEVQEWEYVREYYVSEAQKVVYEYIRAEKTDLHSSIKDKALVIGLRVGGNSDKQSALKAVQAIIQLDQFIKRGGVIKETIPALFTKVYQGKLNLDKEPIKSQQTNRRSMPLIDWLNTK